MTLEEKCKRILDHPELPYNSTKLISLVSHPELLLSPGVAKALLSIGVEDDRISVTLAHSVSKEDLNTHFWFFCNHCEKTLEELAEITNTPVEVLQQYREGSRDVPLSVIAALYRDGAYAKRIPFR